MTEQWQRIRITLDDINARKKAEQEAKDADPAILKKIEAEPDFFKIWDLEEQLSCVKEWRQGHMRLIESKSASKFQILKQRIIMLYEELYLVTPWISFGGFVSHDTIEKHFRAGGKTQRVYRGTHETMFNALAAHVKISRDELNQRMENFSLFWGQMSDQLRLILPYNTEGMVSLKNLEEMSGVLRSIRNDKKFACFFGSHFFDTYHWQQQKFGGQPVADQRPIQEALDYLNQFLQR